MNMLVPAAYQANMNFFFLSRDYLILERLLLAGFALEAVL